jgi:hypothetical protein
MEKSAGKRNNSGGAGITKQKSSKDLAETHRRISSQTSNNKVLKF